jgi:transcriptional accessory protein Tex/SPT6
MVFHVYYADYRRSGENIMSKSLITFIAIVFLAGAVVDADNLYHRIFPETKIVEYRREVRPGDTLWTICGEIATDKEDLRKLVWQAKKDNRIRDVGNLQPGMLIVVKVEEARNG